MGDVGGVRWRLGWLVRDEGEKGLRALGRRSNEEIDRSIRFSSYSDLIVSLSDRVAELE